MSISSISRKKVLVDLDTKGSKKVEGAFKRLGSSTDDFIKKIAGGAAGLYAFSKAFEFTEKVTELSSQNKNLTESYNSLTTAQNLNASIMLEIQEWGIGEPEFADVVDLKRKAPSKADLGAPVTVSLSLKSKETVPVLTIEEHIPANSEVDIKSLEELKKEQKIADYTIDGEKLYLVLVKVKGSVKLEYKLKATREGNGLHAGTRVIDASSGALLASIVSTPLTVN